MLRVTLILHNIFFGTISLKQFSEIFYNFAVGTGALLAGGAGIKAFSEWTQKQKQERELLNNRSRFTDAKISFPREKYKTIDGESGFRLLRNPANGHISIYDLASKTRYLIENMATYYELGYLDDNSSKDWKNITELAQIEQSKYHKFKDGKPIIAT